MAGLLNFFIILGFWGFTTLFETSEEAADCKNIKGLIQGSKSESSQLDF